MKWLLYIFYFEVALNLISGVSAFVVPPTLMTQFTTSAMPLGAGELARWYGVLVLVLAYLLVRALRVRGTVLKIVLEALLVGDIVQIIAVVLTVQTVGSWSLITGSTLVLSIVYMLARIVCLGQPVRTGISASNADGS
jgi:hypothetical protein